MDDDGVNIYCSAYVVYAEIYKGGMMLDESQKRDVREQLSVALSFSNICTLNDRAEGGCQAKIPSPLSCEICWKKMFRKQEEDDKERDEESLFSDDTMTFFCDECEMYTLWDRDTENMVSCCKCGTTMKIVLIKGDYDAE